MTTPAPLPPIAPIEGELIAMILQAGTDGFAAAATLVKPADFRTPLYQSAWGWMVDLCVSGRDVSLMTLAGKYGGHDLFRQLQQAIAEFDRIPLLPSRTEIRAAANQLRDRAKLRDVVAAAQKIAEAAQSATTTDEMQRTTDEYQSILFATALEGECLTVREALWRMDMEDADPDIAPKKFPTGFPSLDRLLTGGLQEQSLMFVAGASGGGKTSLALNMAVNIAKQSIPVAIVSLEMSTRELVNRMIAAEESRDAIRNLPIHIIDSSDISAAGVSTMSRLLKQQHGVSVLIVDYLQLLRESGRRESNREREVAEMGRLMKMTAKRDKIAVICLSQVNEDGLLRESRALNQHSDYELHILDDRSQHWIRLCKNRHGDCHGPRKFADDDVKNNKPPGIEVDFHPQRTLFTE